MPSQKGLKGHLIAKSQNPDPILRISSPIASKELSKRIHVVFLNTKYLNKFEIMNASKHLFKIKRNNIAAWLYFLKRQHPGYRTVEINEDELNGYQLK